MEQDEFKPLIIRDVKHGRPGPEHKLDIAKYTVKAIEFACEHKLDYVIAAQVVSPVIGGLNMVVALSMDKDDYLENLDGCLPTLEEAEEYEYCSKVIKLKELVPTIEFEKRSIKKSIMDAISDL